MAEVIFWAGYLGKYRKFRESGNMTAVKKSQTVSKTSKEPVNVTKESFHINVTPAKSSLKKRK